MQMLYKYTGTSLPGRRPPIYQVECLFESPHRARPLHFDDTISLRTVRLFVSSNLEAQSCRPTSESPGLVQDTVAALFTPDRFSRLHRVLGAAIYDQLLTPTRTCILYRGARPILGRSKLTSAKILDDFRLFGCIPWWHLIRVVGSPLGLCGLSCV